jgi:predicted amidophosphoribosyltransferase
MNLNNEKFFVACSGSFLDLNYGQNYYKNYCEYCNSQLLSQENRCSSCGAPKNSYKVGQSPKIKERNYYE